MISAGRTASTAVAGCAVIAVPGDVYGERVHAVGVLQPGTPPRAASCASTSKAQTAGYEAPRSVHFVDPLPASPAGKVQKRELRAPYWDGASRNVN